MKSKKVNVSARKRRLILTALLGSSLFFLSSCDVVRTITTSAQSYHRNDTSVIIQTKTIESYSAKKQI